MCIRLLDYDYITLILILLQNNERQSIALDSKHQDNIGELVLELDVDVRISCQETQKGKRRKIKTTENEIFISVVIVWWQSAIEKTHCAFFSSSCVNFFLLRVYVLNKIIPMSDSFWTNAFSAFSAFYLICFLCFFIQINILQVSSQKFEVRCKSWL